MYLNDLENSLLDEGLRIIIEEEFINKLIEINSTPDSNLEDLLFKLENIDCRKSHSSALRTWNRRMMLLLKDNKVPQRMHIFMRVKNAIMAKVTEVYTELNKPVKARPILKVKTKSSESQLQKENNRLKAELNEEKRAYKAEKKARLEDKKAHRLELRLMEGERDEYKVEAAKMREVAKQSMIAVVNIGKSVGIEVTEQDMGL